MTYNFPSGYIGFISVQQSEGSGALIGEIILKKRSFWTRMRRLLSCGNDFEIMGFQFK